MDCKSMICDANNLYDAYLKTIKGSKWKETTQKYALNYMRNIFKLQQELETCAYKPGEEAHFILHERGKIRPITTLCPKDRVVRHVLCDAVLFPQLYKRLIYDNYASIKQRGVDMARRRFEVHLHRFQARTGSNKGYILFGDFRKFYDNIDHDIAKDQFLSLLDYDPYLNWLLTMIFNHFQIDISNLPPEVQDRYEYDIFDKLEYNEYPKELFTGERWMEKSVNIGDQLSQLIGIYYPNDIDTYVKTVCGFKEYGRYMDDFYLMSESKQALRQAMDDITRIATGLGIHINEKKTRIDRMDGQYTFLQVRYTMTESGHIIKKINPKRVTCMRRRLKKLATKVETGEVDYIFAQDMFSSWMGGFYKLMSKDQRKNLISLYEELFHKRVQIVKCSGKQKMVYLNKKEEEKHVQSKSIKSNANAEHELAKSMECSGATATAAASANGSKLESTNTIDAVSLYWDSW